MRHKYRGEDVLAYMARIKVLTKVLRVALLAGMSPHFRLPNEVVIATVDGLDICGNADATALVRGMTHDPRDIPTIEMLRAALVSIGHPFEQVPVAALAHRARSALPPKGEQS